MAIKYTLQQARGTEAQISGISTSKTAKPGQLFFATDGKKELYVGLADGSLKTVSPEIINDLVAGGVDKVLSAEQGKLLHELIGAITGGFEYMGAWDDANPPTSLIKGQQWKIGVGGSTFFTGSTVGDLVIGKVTRTDAPFEADFDLIQVEVPQEILEKLGEYYTKIEARSIAAQTYNSAKAYTDLMVKAYETINLHIISATEMSTVQPTGVGVEIPYALTATEQLLGTFEYTLPNDGVALANNIYNLELSFESTSGSLITNIRAEYFIRDQVVFNYPNSLNNSLSRFLFSRSMPSQLTANLPYSAGDKVKLNLYGSVDTGTDTLRLVVNDKDRTSGFIRYSPTGKTLQTHYVLPDTLLSITKDFTSQQISDIVGGVDGWKAIVDAVKASRPFIMSSPDVVTTVQFVNAVDYGGVDFGIMSDGSMSRLGIFFDDVSNEFSSRYGTVTTNFATADMVYAKIETDEKDAATLAAAKAYTDASSGGAYVVSLDIADLSSSSTSTEISDAIGGVDGWNKLVTAITSGTPIVLSDKSSTSLVPGYAARTSSGIGLTYQRSADQNTIYLEFDGTTFVAHDQQTFSFASAQEVSRALPILIPFDIFSLTQSSTDAEIQNIFHISMWSDVVTGISMNKPILATMGSQNAIFPVAAFHMPPDNELSFSCTHNGQILSITLKNTGGLSLSVIGKLESMLVLEAPENGKTYGRKDANWVEMSGGGGGDVSIYKIPSAVQFLSPSSSSADISGVIGGQAGWDAIVAAAEKKTVFQMADDGVPGYVTIDSIQINTTTMQIFLNIARFIVTVTLENTADGEFACSESNYLITPVMDDLAEKVNIRETVSYGYKMYLKETGLDSSPTDALVYSQVIPSLGSHVRTVMHHYSASEKTYRKGDMYTLTIDFKGATVGKKVKLGINVYVLSQIVMRGEVEEISTPSADFSLSLTVPFKGATSPMVSQDIEFDISLTNLSDVSMTYNVWGTSSFSLADTEKTFISPPIDNYVYGYRNGKFEKIIENVVLTQRDYDDLPADEKSDPWKLYIII